MSTLRILTNIFAFTILLSSCDRSELIRIRLLAPISETKKDHEVFSDKSLSSSAKKITSEDPKSSGGSLYLLLKSFGIGFSAITTKLKKEISKTSDSSMVLKEETNLTTNFADVAFGIGENFSFMWGAGILAGGDLESKLNYGYSGATDETIKSESVSGHSLFFVVGHHGYGFETLLGFRTNLIKVSLADSLSSSKTLRTASKIDYKSNGLLITTNQLQLGIGFTF